MSFEVAADTQAFVNISHYQAPIVKVCDEKGNYVYEIHDKSVLHQAITTKLNQSKVAILKAHRNNLITFKIPLHPLIARHHTVQLDSTHVKAKGKVKHIIHECDFNKGSCLSTVTFAVSRTDNDTFFPESTLALPYEDIADEPTGEALHISLPTHLGGTLSALEYDEATEP